MQTLPFCKLPRNQKDTWKPCFDVLTYFVFDLFDEFYIVRGNCHNPNNESQKKQEKKQENCSWSVAAWAWIVSTKASSREIIFAFSLHKHTNLLMLSKKRRALIKIQHANGMNNHRSNSDFRAQNGTIFEYLVILKCQALLLAWLEDGSLYVSLLN